MNTLALRLMQQATRTGLATPFLRPRVWGLVRAIRRHYAETRPPREIETRMAGGIRIRTLLSNHIEAQLFWQGFQEADESALIWLRRLLPRDGVFVDIGANIGSFTLVAAHHARNGTVHAFEPSTYHLDRLRHNIRLNGFTNISVIPYGLSNRTGTATLHLPNAASGMSNTGAASLYDPGQSDGVYVSETVQLIRLDDYWHSLDAPRLDLIKIDVEGAEPAALAGGRRVISELRPPVIMEVDLENLRRADCTATEILNFWRTLDYRVDRIEHGGRLVPITEVTDLQPHQNILCQG
jgi:FkbM family methyltransferase